MNVIIILIIASLTMAVAFLVTFIWAVRNGQYEDTSTPSLRMLAEDDSRKIRRSSNRKPAHKPDTKV